ncbi:MULTISPECIES: hypothetical protein [unclassified Arsenophonus]|uniref:hypothetical protein n=1 Tax=unclassified Arsenophonus TaxID=2627083 RepID=UPI00285E0BD1|nr:hypothetical protein [Arsenophonus sp.]MDR5610799.1 hypothetical protein [Arsenophonus sp.]MDR5614743.1 hypothetical protein [Arsenophonus sp.]
MAKIKSLITRIEIDTAKHSHNCQANSRHRIKAGDFRLNVRNGRSWDRYCFTCAQTILEQDLKKIIDLKTQLNETQS